MYTLGWVDMTVFQHLKCTSKCRIIYKRKKKTINCKNVICLHFGYENEVNSYGHQEIQPRHVHFLKE